MKLSSVLIWIVAIASLCVGVFGIAGIIENKLERCRCNLGRPFFSAEFSTVCEGSPEAQVHFELQDCQFGIAEFLASLALLLGAVAIFFKRKKLGLASIILGALLGGLLYFVYCFLFVKETHGNLWDAIKFYPMSMGIGYPLFYKYFPLHYYYWAVFYLSLFASCMAYVQSRKKSV